MQDATRTRTIFKSLCKVLSHRFSFEEGVEFLRLKDYTLEDATYPNAGTFIEPSARLLVAKYIRSIANLPPDLEAWAMERPWSLDSTGRLAAAASRSPGASSAPTPLVNRLHPPRISSRETPPHRARPLASRISSRRPPSRQLPPLASRISSRRPPPRQSPPLASRISSRRPPRPPRDHRPRPARPLPCGCDFHIVGMGTGNNGRRSDCQGFRGFSSRRLFYGGRM